ncbi:MAG TPA: glycosyltransferase [Rariglobus sp.]|jgi:glycosyltransferase involved in cell wall biosynthesis|nr:glycosyltransferase [Rariglobus sp.]
MAEKFLIYNPGVEGGIPRYAYYQGFALKKAGCHVIMVCARESINPLNGVIQVSKVLAYVPPKKVKIIYFKRLAKFLRGLGIVSVILYNQIQLAVQIIRSRPNAVLLASYEEYLSPVWVWWHIIIKRCLGVTYLANLHDPVRDFVVGPLWWHRLSVRMAYGPISCVFVHQQVSANAGVPKEVRIKEVPHGLFDTGGKLISTEKIRAEWHIPEDAVAFLAFGFIRDGKNLDLLIKALVFNPDAYLIVIGRVQSAARDKPVSFYCNLADSLGVSSRVRFKEEFIQDQYIGSYIAAADVVAMTYGETFHSQSGVLNTVAKAMRPLLVSAGESPLKDVVLRYNLGVFVKPDSVEELSGGISQLTQLIKAQRKQRTEIDSLARAGWNAYLQYASWDVNAATVLDAFKEVKN